MIRIPSRYHRMIPMNRFKKKVTYLTYRYKDNYVTFILFYKKNKILFIHFQLQYQIEERHFVGEDIYQEDMI